MAYDKPIHRSVLATDLDGTLLPLPGHPENARDLAVLARLHEQGRLALIYATGRHAASCREAIRAHALPRPDWMVCDVGTSVIRGDDEADTPHPPYETHLRERTRGATRKDVETALRPVDGLTLQPPENQGPFKISYLCPPGAVDDLVSACNRRLRAETLPFESVGSVDPAGRQGLLDVLPAGVAKAHALAWLIDHAGYPADRVVFAGDSGNDVAALTAGFRAIVVGNASPGLADRVRETLRASGREDRLYCASGAATSGVLEGCRHFGVAPPAA